MLDDTAGAAVCVGNAGRPGAKPCVNDLPLGVRLPFHPFVLPLPLLLPLGKDGNFPFPFPFGPILVLPLPSRLPFLFRNGEGATRLVEEGSVR